MIYPDLAILTNEQLNLLTTNQLLIEQYKMNLTFVLIAFSILIFLTIFKIFVWLIPKYWNKYHDN